MELRRAAKSARAGGAAAQRRRAWRLGRFLLASSLACGAWGACSAPRVEHPAPLPASVEKQLQLQPPPRRPDGVVLEPPAAVPQAASRAASGGVVVLRAPVPREAVVDLVRSFIEGWQHESVEALVALLAEDAGPIDARGRGSRPLVEGWRQRMRTHAYGRLAGMELVRPEHVERWEPEELGAPGAPARPADIRPGELLVRAPLEVTTVLGEKLFGDAIVMLVRSESSGLRITAYGEVEAR